MGSSLQNIRFLWISWMFLPGLRRQAQFRAVCMKNEGRIYLLCSSWAWNTVIIPLVTNLIPIPFLGRKPVFVKLYSDTMPAACCLVGCERSWGLWNIRVYSAGQMTSLIVQGELSMSTCGDKLIYISQWLHRQTNIKTVLMWFLQITMFSNICYFWEML